MFQRVAAHALIVNNEGKVLVAHRMATNDWKPNEWDIFGGSIEMGELDPEKALAREIMEEAGLKVKVIRLLDVYASLSNQQRHQFQMTYLCEYLGGEIVMEENDHDEYRWVTVQELAELPNKIAFLESLSNNLNKNKFDIR